MKLCALVRLLSEKPLAAPSGAIADEGVIAAVREHGLDILPWGKEAEILRRRLGWLNRGLGDPWPSMDDDNLIERLDDWLLPFLTGEAQLDRIPTHVLKNGLMSLVPFDLQRSVDQLAPTHFEVPTGSNIPIRYDAEEPVIAVRVQELFGLEVTRPSPMAKCHSCWNYFRQPTARSRSPAIFPASGRGHGPMCAPTCEAATRSMSGRKIRLMPKPREGQNHAELDCLRPDNAVLLASICTLPHKGPIGVIMHAELDNRASNLSRKPRLTTLVRIRWLAIAGQTATVMFVALYLQFNFAVGICFALIACSAWLNLYLAFRFPTNHRLSPTAASIVLAFDILQLAGLLYLTGGVQNPFVILMIAPVIISATSLSVRHTLALALLVVLSTSVLTMRYEPLPWYPGEALDLPFLFVAGIWCAIIAALGFTGIYAYRIAEETRQLGDALAATELILQREQHLTALDGLAAAAAHELGTPLATITLVVKEMQRSYAKTER